MAERSEFPFLTRIDWLVCLLLFVGLSSFYFATTSGITSSNDGSHYALTRTLVQNGSFALKSFDDYAEGNDIAVHDGVLYSDRPPGTALLATLFYLAGEVLPAPWRPLPSRHDADHSPLLYVMLLPIWAGTGTAVLLYLLLRRLDIEAGAALTTVLMWALGTAHWKYSTVLFSHALSGFLIMVALFLALTWHSDSGWSRAFLLGFGLGYGVLVEYSNVLLVVIVAVYLVWALRPFNREQLRLTWLPFFLGGLGPALFLAYYNRVNFGSPFTLSYAYAINYPWASSFRTTFNFPLLAGLRSLLVFGTGDGQCDPVCYNQGLLLLSPILALVVPGFIWYGQRAWRTFLLTTAVFLIYLLLFAAHRTSHGFTADGRYLTPFLSLLAIPLAYTIVWLRSLQTGHSIWHALLTLLFYGLFFLSWHNMLWHIGFSYNYNLDLNQLSDLVAAPQNWWYVTSEIFRNTANLPLLWLSEAILLLPFFLWWRRQQRAV